MNTGATKNSRTKDSVSDSPWFWVYLFAACALIGLIIIQPKFRQRQSMIERKGEARKQLVSQDQDDSIAASGGAGELKTVGLRPLILLLAIGVCGGWTVFWLKRMNRRSNRLVADAGSTESSIDKLSDSSSSDGIARDPSA